MKTSSTFLFLLLACLCVYAQPSYTISTDKIKPGETWTISGKGYPANTIIYLSFTKTEKADDYTVTLSNDPQYDNSDMLAFMNSNRKYKGRGSEFQIEINSKGEFTEYVRFYPYMQFFEKDKTSRKVYCQVRISKNHTPVTKPVEFTKAHWILTDGGFGTGAEQKIHNTVWDGLTLKATELFTFYTSFRDVHDVAQQFYEVSGLGRTSLLSSQYGMVWGGPTTEYPLGKQTLTVYDKITREAQAVNVTVVGEPKAVIRPTRPSIRPGDPLLVNCYNFSSFSPKTVPNIANSVYVSFSGPSKLAGYETNKQGGIQAVKTDGTVSFLIGTAAQQEGSVREIGRFVPQFEGDKMKPGEYTISVLDIVSGKTLTATFTVSENAPASGSTPNVDFSTSGDIAWKPTQFRANPATGAAAWWQWQWEFGDGTISREQNPTHTYKKAGSYNVYLQVTNPGFPAKNITKSIEIKEGPIPAPVDGSKPTPNPNPVTNPVSVTNTPSTVTSADGKLSISSADKIKSGETWTISGKGYPANSTISVYFTEKEDMKDDGNWIGEVGLSDYHILNYFINSDRDHSTYSGVQTNSKGEFSEQFKFYPPADFFEKGKNSHKLYCRVRISQQYAPIIKPIEIIKAPWILVEGTDYDNDQHNPANTVWDGMRLKATEKFTIYTSFAGEDDELYEILAFGKKVVGTGYVNGGPGTEYPVGKQTLSVYDKITRETGTAVVTVLGEPKTVVRPARSSIRPGEPLIVNCYNFSTGNATGKNVVGIIRFTFSGPSKLVGYEDRDATGARVIKDDGTCTILIGTAVQQSEAEKIDSRIGTYNLVGQFVPQNVGDKMKAGEYAISALDVTSGKTFTAKFTVSENAPASSAPIANFSAAGNTALQPTQFKDESKGSVTNWEWNFGDYSSSASEQNPTHTYAMPGTYKVNLKVGNPGFPISTIEKQIVIKERSTPVTTTTPTPTTPAQTTPTSETTVAKGVSIRSPANGQSVMAGESFVLSTQLAAGSVCATFKVEVFQAGETTPLLTPYPVVRLGSMAALPLSLSVSPGQYTVRISCLTQPTLMSEVTLTVQKGAGRLSADDLLLYPNPSNGLFDVDLSKLDGKPQKITITDDFGSTVWEQPVRDNCCPTLRLENRRAGVYTVTVLTDKGVVSKKIIINR